MQIGTVHYAITVRKDMSRDTDRKTPQSLKEEAISSDKLKWQRGCLYAESRELFKKDTEFGAWISEWSTAGGIPQDAQNTRSKLIMATKHLSEADFLELGYTKAAELMDKGMWKDHPSMLARNFANVDT